MTIKKIEISAEDLALLNEQFSIDHPSEIPDLVKRIGPDDRVIDLQWTYFVRAKEGEREKWVSCAACGKRRNHLHGFVVILEGKRCATVGRNCGETKHSLTYQEHIDRFDSRKLRADRLRALIRAFDGIDPVSAYLDSLPDGDFMRTLIDLRLQFSGTFAHLFKYLNGFPNGIIRGNVQIVDDDAMRERDGRLDRKLDDLARRTGIRRDAPGNERHLLTRLGGDPDASKERLFKRETQEILRLKGKEFLFDLTQIRGMLRHARAELRATLISLSTKSSADLSTKQLLAAVSGIQQQVQNAIDLVTSLNRAAEFLATSSLQELVRTANRIPALKSAGIFSVSGTSLNQGSNSLAMDPPEFSPPLTPLTQYLSSID